jgi:PAS domain S-box-containing protein
MAILRGPSFVVEIANDRMFELWGRGKEQLLHKSIFEGLPEAKDQGYEDLLNEVFTTGNTFSAHGIPVTLPRHGKKETVYIDLLYEAFREGDGTISGVMAVATEVTAQVLARMQMEESNKQFQFVTDFMPQIIWSTKPDGYHDFYNKRWYDYTGLTYEQSKDSGWNSVLHPDDLERAQKVWRRSLDTGEPYEIEYRFRRCDGSYRWFLGRALPLKDDTGAVLKWYGTLTDIDDQKKSSDLLEEKVKERTLELESQKKELERSNANLEDFAYAASHDLKEPIRKIRTFSDRLKHQLKDRLLDEDQYFLQRMDKSTERMQLLIDDLLEYSHVSTSTNYSEEINLNKKVSQVLEDLEVEIVEKNAKVTVGPLPSIKGHRRQIQQVFQNLITNALKFRKPDVRPEIQISSAVISGENVNTFNSGEKSKYELYNMIQVSDNGIGFEQDHAEKIFKMFQRLHGKAEYDGTGIGLAIVRKVVENHHGFITAEGKPGEGATFKIFLPIQ